MRYEFILKGARVIDPVNQLDQTMDVAVCEGKIAAVAAQLDGCDNLIDMTGRVIIPGGIDAHVHCDSMLGGEAGFYMVAKTGITTIVDFAGPPDEISASLLRGKGYGLNVAVLETVRPDPVEGLDLSKSTVEAQFDKAVRNGALGLKLLGGHFPLSPRASELAVDVANEHRAIIAIHSGSTEHRSDLLGMRESILDFVHGRPAVLAHINAYCRGRVKPVLQELEEAFGLLRDNPNIYADSHLATMNATHGKCREDQVEDQITVNCLNTFGYPTTRKGLEAAILDGVARVIQATALESLLIERQEALAHFKKMDTHVMVSFPANLPLTACACALERVRPGGEFLIGIAATDGGGIPRNNLIGRLLHFYHLGYLSLADIVYKICINPARVFGFRNKGHLSPGADADMTVLDLASSSAVMSFAKGRMIMKDGLCVGSNGCMLVPPQAAKTLSTLGLEYDVIHVEKDSILYRAP